MSIALTIFFAAMVALGVRLPELATAIVTLMLVIEQVAQASIPALRGGIGSQLANYLIGVMALLGAFLAIVRDPKCLIGFANPSLILTVLLFGWAAVSLLWSPAMESGYEIVSWGFPYFIITLVVTPILLKDLDDLVRMNRWVLIVGLAVMLGVLLSPEFNYKGGRLFVALGGGAASSALSIGEAGGTVLITAALARQGFSGPLMGMIRLAAIGTGMAVAILSGSRGQFFFAVGAAIALIPVSAPLKSPRSFIAGVVGLAIVLISAQYLMSTLLEGFAAKRFSADEMLYGSSSAAGRWRNVAILFEAWISSPTALVVGLGYNAFAGLPDPTGEPYSHVVFADAIFELGIVGATLLTVLMYRLVVSLRYLWERSRSNPSHRAAVATLIALSTYQTLLINKQGSLWGVPLLFLYIVVADRLAYRQRFSEEQGPEWSSP